jgi:hypothetical protein
MSESLLTIIPQEPSYTPDVIAVLRAGEFLLSKFPDADGTHSETFDEIRFIDAGSNFENIVCPTCGKEIAMDWWSDAMDKAHESQFTNLNVVTPCCNSHITLNDLHYHFPQGFAQCVLTVRNPDISEMDEQTKSKLEQILDCKIRIIFAHY